MSDESQPGNTSRNRIRRRQILSATLRLVRHEGVGVSTARIAAQANCSKETIYNWFGSREGLFEALVREQCVAMNDALSRAVSMAVSGAMEGGASGSEAALLRLGMAMLDLMTGEASLATHRLAMAQATSTQAPLGDVLQAGGRDAVRLIGNLLQQAQRDGVIAFDDLDDAVGLFVGLVLRDVQIRCLTGAQARPDGEEMRMRAQEAVERLKIIYAP